MYKLVDLGLIYEYIEDCTKLILYMKRKLLIVSPDLYASQLFLQCIRVGFNSDFIENTDHFLS